MAREITDGVWLLEVAWPEPIGSNAYLLDDGDVTLADAGVPIPRRSLSAEIRETGHTPSALDRVLLTHYDIDHVGGLARIDLDIPVYLGALDVRLVRRSWSPPWRHHKGAFHRFVRRSRGPISDRFPMATESASSSQSTPPATTPDTRCFFTPSPILRCSGISSGVLNGASSRPPGSIRTTLLG